MDNTFKQWFLDTFDDYVGSHQSEGSEVEDSRAAVSEAYAEAVRAGQIQPPPLDEYAQGRRYFDQIVGSERDRRRNGLRKELDYILDIINDPDSTILGLHDPRFKQAIPLGNGSDKTLGYWTADDWTTAAAVRVAEAEDKGRSAKLFKGAADQVREAMIQRGAITTRELVADLGVLL